MDTKRCTKCGEEKPATAEWFYHRSNGKLTAQCKECIKVRLYKPRHENPEMMRERNRIASQKWRDEHPEESRERARIATAIWRRENPDKWMDKNRQNVKNWRLNNPQKRLAAKQRRRARKKELPATFTESDWQRVLEYFNGVCAYCGNPPSETDQYPTLQQDHLIPLISGGGYTPDNIVPACGMCNQSKNDKDVEEWLVKRFGENESQIILERIRNYLATVK